MQTNNWLTVARALLGRTYYDFNEGQFVATVLNQSQRTANTTDGVWASDVVTISKSVDEIITTNQVAPGDLLFWGLKVAPYHVAIYVGGSQFIHASEVDNVIKIQTIQENWYPNFAGRVR